MEFGGTLTFTSWLGQTLSSFVVAFTCGFVAVVYYLAIVEFKL